MTVADVTKQLLIDSPFYGTVLLGMSKVEDTSIPTMCISIYNGAAVIVYNPDFWDSLTDEQQYECMKHELLHICLFHPFQVHEFSDLKNRNIAADAEVNQYLNIANLPGGCVDILKWYPNWPAKAGMREYYRRLTNANSLPKQLPNHFQQQWEQREEEKKERGDSKGSGNPQSPPKNPDCTGPDMPSNSGMGNMPTPNSMQQPKQKPANSNSSGGNSKEYEEIINHDSWKKIENMSDSEKQLLKNQVESIVNDAAESCGKVPGEMEEIIGKIKAKNVPKFDWKGYLRRLVGVSEERFIKFTYRRPSKRFYDAKGVSHKRKHRMLIALDCSGSVCAKEVYEFYATMCSMQKADVEMDVIEFDTQICREYPFKTWDGTITGRGGTEYGPVFDYANKYSKKYNALVILTDGYCNIPTKKCIVPTIWVISSGGHHQYYPGKTVYIPKSNGSDND